MKTLEFSLIGKENNLEEFLKEKLSEITNFEQNIRIRFILKEEDETSSNKIKIAEDIFSVLKEECLSFNTATVFQNEKNEIILDDNFLDDF